MFTCRECEREINQASEVCPYCGADLMAAPESVKPLVPPKPWKTALRYAVLLALIWGFLWYVLPEQRSRDAMQQAETHAVAAMRAAGEALAAHATAQEGAYPASLEALPAESADRVRAAAQAAQREGYRLDYQPEAPGADGRIRQFVLLGRPRNYGYPNFYLDPSGVLRVTRENRAATAQDHPY